MTRSRARSRGAALALVLILAAGLAAAFFIVGGYIGSRKLDSRGADAAAFLLIHEALARFAQVNRRLPCPANGASSTGAEHVLADTTDCQSPAGPVPWSTLGLRISAATDTHGRLYGYRVYDGATGFTRANGLSLADCLDQDDADLEPLTGGICKSSTHENTRSDFFSGKGLTVNDRGTPRPQIAYVLLTHGPSGYGAFMPDPSVTMTTPTAGGKEAVNASDSLTYWILDVSDTTVTVDNVNHFDDVLSYKNVTDLTVSAKLGGRPWPLSARLDASNVVPVFSNNLFSATANAILTTGNAMTITAAASSARSICTVSSTPVGIAPCGFLSFGGSDKLTTSGDERLVFEFRVARRFLKVKLADFRLMGVNAERARFTFYNGATQVHEVVKSACETGPDATARFTFDPGVEFTKVEIRADDSSTSSAIAVSSIAGCKLSDSVYCSLRETDGTTCS